MLRHRCSKNIPIKRRRRRRRRRRHCRHCRRRRCC